MLPEIKEQLPVQKVSVGVGWRRYKSLKEAKKDKLILQNLNHSKKLNGK